MTVFAHKAIDALLGRGKTHKLFPLKGIDQKQRQNVAAVLEASQKFDFGELHLERMPDGTPGRWLLPQLSQEECIYWQQGLIPLPFQSCWFEFVINGSRSGLLVMEDMADHNPGIYIHRMDLLFSGEVLFDGVLLGIEGASKDGLRCSISGNQISIDSMRRTNRLEDSVVMNGPLVVFLTMMLNSPTTETAVVPQPKFLNKKRVGKGLTPLPAHRTVHIVPSKYLEKAEQEAKSEQRLPRLHWRRSHLRHFDHQTGNSKYMPTLMHKGTEGWWVTLIPRMLVGKPELGSIDHDYKIG